MKIHDPKLTGSIEIQNPIPGTSPLTSSWAVNVVNGTSLSGGEKNYIPIWSSSTSLSTSSIYQTQSLDYEGGFVAINTTEFDPTFPEALLISGSTINIVSGKANISEYAQLNITNLSDAAGASSDIVATNDTGDEGGNYIDMGINSSGFTGLIGGANDAYLYTTGSQFLIGNQTRGTNAQLKLFAGNDATVFPVVVTGSQAILTGSLLGTASYVTGSVFTSTNRALSASHAVSSSNSSTASFVNNLNQNLVVTGSVILSGSSTAELFVLGDQQITGSLNVSSSIIARSITGSFTGSLTGNLIGTASYVTGSIFSGANQAASASYARSSSYAITASYSNNGFPYSGSQAQITGALSITGSLALWPGLDPDLAGSNTSTAYFFVSQSQYSGDSTQDLYYRNAGYLWSQDYLQQAIDTGIVYGGIVTFTGSAGTDTPPNATEIRITPGIGLLIDHNATTSSKGETVPSVVSFGPITQSFKNEITSSQIYYLYIDTAGTLQYQTTTFNTEQYHTQFPLGAIFNLTTSSISSFGDLRVTAYGQTQQAGEFVRAFGPLKESGFDITPISTTLSASIASGKAYRFGGFYTQNPETPSTYVASAVPTASFVRVYRDPAVVGGYRAQVQTNGAPYRAIDPTKYDDGSGTLQAVGSGEFTIQRLFQGVVNSVTYVYYGQNKYTSLTNALNSITTEDFAESQTSIVTLPFIGYVIVEGTATSLADTNTSRIINAGLFRNTAGSSGGGGAAVTNLNDLGDVVITSPTNGQALIYNTGNWVNGNPTSASYAENGGVTQIVAGTNVSISPTNGLGAVTINSTGGGGDAFPYTGSAIISGSLRIIESGSTGLVISGSNSITGALHVDGNAKFTGSLFVTASRSNMALHTIGDIVLSGSIVASASFGQQVITTIGDVNFTGSVMITSSGVSSRRELVVIGEAAITGSLNVSNGATFGSVTSSQGIQVNGGNSVITGSLVVSGSGGYGVFSKGITLADLTNGFTVTGSYYVWRSPFPCRVVAVYAIHSGSSQLSVNARRSGSGASLHLATNLNITADNLWTAGGAVQNTDYSAGDSLELIISGSDQYQASVQVDFIKR